MTNAIVKRSIAPVDVRDAGLKQLLSQVPSLKNKQIDTEHIVFLLEGTQNSVHQIILIRPGNLYTFLVMNSEVVPYKTVADKEEYADSHGGFFTFKDGATGYETLGNRNLKERYGTTDTVAIMRMMTSQDVVPFLPRGHRRVMSMISIGRHTPRDFRLELEK